MIKISTDECMIPWRGVSFGISVLAEFRKQIMYLQAAVVHMMKSRGKGRSGASN